MGRHHRRAFLALGLAGALLAGCSSSTSNNPDGGADTATLAVLHASPDAPAVDIYARGISTPLFANVSYGGSKAPLSVPAGTPVTIDVRPAGAAPTTTPVYTAGPLTFMAGQAYTAIAAGLLASTDPASSFRILPLEDGFTMPAAGKVRVRIVHAGADAPTVGLDVNNDGTIEVPSLARFADTGAAGVELPAATALQVGIVAGSPAAKVTAFTIPALPAGTEVYVVATGLLSKLPRESEGFALLAEGAGLIQQNPTLYALHAGADAPAVDVYAGSAKLTSLSFGQLSAPIQVPPSSTGYTLTFFPAGTSPTGTPAATATTPAVAAGQRYLAIATGLLSGAGSTAFQLQAVQEGFTIDATQANLRVIHSSPDAPEVDVGTVTSGTFTAIASLSGLSFPQSSPQAGQQVPAASLTVGVAAHGSPTPVAKFSVTTSNNERAFVVAAGLLNPTGTEKSFRLLAVDTSTNPSAWAAASVPPN